MGIEKILNDIIAKPTTAEDLFKIAKKKCNVFEYDELNRFDNLNDIFKKGNSPIEIFSKSSYPFDSKCCIILYNTSPEMGHWTMIIKNDTGYNYLDSYGDYIDEDVTKKQPKYLSKLLSKTDRPIYYNNNRMQELSNNVATCGLYCAAYLKYSYMNVDSFANMIEHVAKDLNTNPDVVVSLISLL